MKHEPNLVKLGDPVIIVGDIHGQYYDLCHLAISWTRTHPSPESMNWLFLGDYVDRGMFDIEVTVQLLVWKILYPKIQKKKFF